MSSSLLEIEFRCPIEGCTRKYASKDKLKGHIRKSHSAVPQEDLQALLANVSAGVLCNFSFPDGTVCRTSLSSRQKREAHMKLHSAWTSSSASAGSSVPSTETPASQPQPPPSSSPVVPDYKPNLPRNHNIDWTDEVQLDDDDSFERQLHQLWFKLNTRASKTSSTVGDDGNDFLAAQCML
eukprot:CAMPEP_0184643976 /NCGR_PEP_ID=MMETSP0308-20130426/771_1 /TAXON_ID=38269 /ORGANISM="Gloeochaete witrockiana, Strain SAG 46.84" /LENGTH=180 /DNA_ID=CAMNT_0027072253 /DNA_START=129 /DNA_END=668 /DNA_ORIENTATION=+